MFQLIARLRSLFITTTVTTTVTTTTTTSGPAPLEAGAKWLASELTKHEEPGCGPFRHLDNGRDEKP